MRNSSSSAAGKIRIVLVVVGVVAICIGYFFWIPKVAEDVAPSAPTVPDAGVAERPMSEEERIAYVKEFVKVYDVNVGPDKKPDSEEPVPGLLRVTGQVVNTGARKIDKVIVVVYPLNASDEVMGSFSENVAARPLAPGTSASFKFALPERPGFSGRIQHEVR